MLQLFTSLLGRKPESAAARKTSPRFQPSLETLEDRRLMTISLGPTGTLVMDGSAQVEYGWVSPIVQNGVKCYRAYMWVGNVLEDKTFEAVKVREIRFRGFGGNDTFANNTALPSYQWGGEGNDNLVGGSGYDVIYGEGGNDYLSDQSTTSKFNPWSTPGSPQFDNYLFGGAGIDTLQGSSANDQLAGGDNDDKLYGGNGNDWLYGETGNDLLDGGWGNDVLYGDGNDWMTGFQGNDWLWGGAGADTLYGDAGADHLQYDPADAIRDMRPNEGDLWWS